MEEIARREPLPVLTSDPVNQLRLTDQTTSKCRQVCMIEWEVMPLRFLPAAVYPYLTWFNGDET